MIPSHLISVIIPVFNAERWLPRAIDSVLGQSHTHLELILVDDGSTDSSLSICDSYASRDSRVRVIHKANGGVSAARNDGLDASRGGWMAFCDNDDFYAPDMLSRLLAICVDNDCDIAQCRAERGTSGSFPTPPPENVKVMTGRRMLESFYTESSPWIWDKLYRRHVWDNVRFPVGSRMYEDNIIIHRLWAAARRVATTSEKLYYYYRNPESVTGRRFDVRWTLIPPYDDRIAMARTLDLPRLLAGTMTTRFYNEGCWLVMNRRYNRDAASRRAFHMEHSVLLRRYYREAMATPRISAKHKAFMMALRYAPPLYHLYNYLKWRVLRGERNVRFGEIK